MHESLELLFQLFDSPVILDDHMGDILESAYPCLRLRLGFSDEFLDGFSRIGSVLSAKRHSGVAGGDICIYVDELKSLKVAEVFDIALPTYSVDDNERRCALSDIREDNL